jgi:hypothetical protein
MRDIARIASVYAGCRHMRKLGCCLYSLPYSLDSQFFPYHRYHTAPVFSARGETAAAGVNECNGDLTPICPRAAALPLSSPREKTREKKTSRGSALVHATPGATASRLAGRSANRTTPITRFTITSVKFLWTP